MRHFLGSFRVLAVVLAVAAAPAVRADQASHEAAIKRFFVVAQMSQLIDSTLEQMTEMQVKSNPAMAPYRDTMLRFFRKYMAWSSLEPDIAKLYAKEFSEAEILEITRFYETPTGKKVMKKLPELSAKGAAIGQARVQANIQELQAMIQADQAKLEGAKKPAESAPMAP